MQDEKNSTVKAKKKFKTKIFKLLLILLIIVIFSVLAFVPVYVSSEKGRRVILAKINKAVDGKTDFADLTMSWWKGIRITDLRFNDSAAATSVKIKQITTKPRYLSILMGNLSFGQTILDEPQIEINLKDSPLHSKPEGKTPSTKKTPPLVLPANEIDLIVNNGNLKVKTDDGGAVELSQLNSHLNLRSPGRQTCFELDTTVIDNSGKSRVYASGRFKPDRREGWTLKAADGDLTLEVSDLDINSLIPLFTMAGIDIQAEGKISTNIKSEIKDGKIENFNGTIRGRNLNITGPVLEGGSVKTASLDVDIKLQRRKDTLNIQALKIKTDWADVNIKGTVPTTLDSLAGILEPDSRYDLKGDADLDLAAIFSQMPAAFGGKEAATVTSGRLKADVRTFVEDGRRKISGTAVLDNFAGTVKGKPIFEPEAKLTLSGAFDAESETFDFDFINAQAGFGRIGIKDFALRLDKEALKPMKLTASADVDLAALGPYVQLFADLPETMQLAGKAQSQISVRSKNGIYQVKTDKTEIRDLKFSRPGQKPFEQSQVLLIFDADIEPAKKNIEVKRFELTSPQIKLKGNLSQKTKGRTTELSGRADCEYDWQDISSMASAFLPENLKLKGKRTDSIDFKSRYPAMETDKLLANLNTSGRLGFEQADFMGLVFGPTEVNIQIQNGLLQIAPFSTTVNNGQLNFAGQANFKQKPTLLRTPEPMEIAKDIQINDQTTRKLLMYVNPVFANTVNVSGTANFKCEKLAIPLAKADKNDIEVVGTLAINNLRLRASDLLGQILLTIGEGPEGQDITIHPTRFVLRNGLLRYDNMQMDVGDNPVNFRGVIGLDKSLDMKVTLPYTFEGKTVKVGRESDDERITVSLRGTVDNPQLDLGKLLEEQLEQRLRQELQKALEDLFK